MNSKGYRIEDITNEIDNIFNSDNPGGLLEALNEARKALISHSDNLSRHHPSLRSKL
jgi:hypothetical protein